MEPLTESENDLLRRHGQFTLHTTIPLMTEATFWGMYVLVMMLAVYGLCVKGITSRARVFLLLTTLLMFLMSTTLFAFDIFGIMYQTKGIFLKKTEEGQALGEKIMAIAPILDMVDLVGQVVFPLEFLVGDGVVIWRTWALWQDMPLMMAFPGVLWIASLGTFIAGRVCDAQTPGTAVVEPGCTQDLVLANWTLSMSTNAVATTMIAYRAWTHRRVLKEALGASTKTTQAERILALLVESGFIYLLLWSIQTLAFHDFEEGGGYIFSLAITSAGNQLVGLYPTVIIVMVDFQRTIWDYTRNSDASRTRDMSSLHFASGAPPHSGRATTHGASIHVKSLNVGSSSEETIRRKAQIGAENV